MMSSHTVASSCSRSPGTAGQCNESDSSTTSPPISPAIRYNKSSPKEEKEEEEEDQQSGSVVSPTSPPISPVGENRSPTIPGSPREEERSSSSGSPSPFHKKNRDPRLPPTYDIVLATKSYDNKAWLHSRAARHVRIMCEYLEVQDRMRHQQVMCTLLVFGSARCYRRDQWEDEIRKAKADIKLHATATATAAVDHHHIGSHDLLLQAAEKRISFLYRIEWLCEYWEITYKLSKLLMEWVQTPEARKAIAKVLREVPGPAGGSTDEYALYDAEHAENLNYPEPLALCTGGGPGMMEAANKAAYDTPGARSMGMGISLPFEPGLNKYVHKDLAFEFHYFFTRKFWMLYSALGLIATPGGLGTMDELMEVLTLKQTRKFKRDIPVILLGKQFWTRVLNFDALVEFGTINPEDRDQMFLTDSPEEAFNHIKNHFLSGKLLLREKHIHKSSIRNAAALDISSFY